MLLDEILAWSFQLLGHPRLCPDQVERPQRASWKDLQPESVGAVAVDLAGFIDSFEQVEALVSSRRTEPLPVRLVSQQLPGTLPVAPLDQVPHLVGQPQSCCRELPELQAAFSVQVGHRVKSLPSVQLVLEL